MRFLVQGDLHADALAAMTKHEQVCHTLADLSAGNEGISEVRTSPKELLPLLEKKQWQLLTTDAAFVREMYEQKYPFSGIIVLLLESVAGTGQAGGIDRLFERYKRLTPRRLYTVTASRVKIRQLPGAGQV